MAPPSVNVAGPEVCAFALPDEWNEVDPGLGGGTPESAQAAFGHFAEDVSPFENMVTGPQLEPETAPPTAHGTAPTEFEDRLVGGPSEFENMVTGPQLEPETAPPTGHGTAPTEFEDRLVGGPSEFENMVTGPQLEPETAPPPGATPFENMVTGPQLQPEVPPPAITVPAKPSPEVVAELGAIDWTTKGGVDTFRQRLRGFAPEDRIKLLQSLPKESQSIGFCALQMATADDQFAKNAIAGMNAASDKGKLDAFTIRDNLRNVPKDLREKALSELPEVDRKQAQDQLAKDDAIMAANAGSVAKLKQLDWSNPNVITVDARQALQAIPPEERAAIIENLPTDQRAIATNAVGIVLGDDFKAAAAAKVLSESGDKLDSATIHAQLRAIPPGMRDRALAGLPEATKKTIADQSAKDRETVAANQSAVNKLRAFDFTKDGTYPEAIATLSEVPAAERAALIESLPAGQRECASVATSMLSQQEVNATIGADMLKKASANGVPDSKAIEMSLGLMAPAVRAKAIADLPESTRAAVEAKIVEGKERAAEGVKVLMTAGGGKTIDKEAVHKALKDLPAWERQNVLNSLSKEAKAAAEDGLGVIEKCETAKKAVEALATSDEESDSTTAMDKALEGVPPERYSEVKGELSPAAQAELAKTEKTHKEELEEKLDRLEFSTGFDDPTEELKDQVSDIPEAMRDAVVSSLSKGDKRDQASQALSEVKTDEENSRKYDARLAITIGAGAKEFADLAKAKPQSKPGDDPGKVEDAQKQYDKKVQEALAKIPYREREKALEAMPEDARVIAQAAIATKKAEMNAKAAQMFNAINAGVLANGTDTTTILQTLATLTPDERRELEDEYAAAFKDEKKEGRSLESDLMKEFQDEKTVFGAKKKDNKLDRELISAVFSGDTTEQKAIALQLGARGSSSTDCTDEALIMKTLESIKDPDEREKVFKTFKERQEEAGQSDTDVSQMLRSEMVTGAVDKNDYEYKRALALTHGKFEEAKSVEIEEAMDPGLLGKVSIRDVATVASFVPGGGLVSGAVGLADATGLIDAERKVAEPDTEKAAGVYATADSQTQRDKIDAAHAENNDGKSVADIARERCPDKHDVLLVESASKNDKDGMAAARWKKNEAKMNSDEQGMMKQIEGDRHKQVVARIDAEFGEGMFESRSKAVMNDEELAANKELSESGKVKPLTGLLATMPTVSTGWALEDIEKHLRDPKDPKKLLSKDEMVALKKELCDKQDMTPEEFDEMIDHKLGGKEAFKLRQMMKGEPATREERMTRLKEEQDFNREGIGNLAGKMLTDTVSTAGVSQDANYELLKDADAKITELEKKKADGSISEAETAELKKAEKDLDERSDYYGTNVKAYQTSRDSISNDVTTIAAATAGAIATVVTGGAAGPLVGALITGLTTIASKQLLLGGTYNERDQMKDELQTMFSMGAAGASTAAGPAIDLIANKLGGAAGAMLKGPAGEVIKELVTAGSKGMIGGGLSGLMSTTSGVLLEDKTLQGKGEVGEMIKKVGFGTLSSAAGGGVSGVVGKGLDLGGLQSADPTKTFSAGGHAANKALSTAAGDATAFVVDPANLNQPDALGKFLQKEAMGLPGSAIGAYGDHRTASRSRQQTAKALGIPDALIDAPENQARISAFENHRKNHPGFLDGIPLTDEEKVQKAAHSAEQKKLTKPIDDDVIPIHLETDDFDPRQKAKPEQPEISLELQARDLGCGADTARQAAALAKKSSLSLPEAIERLRQGRNLQPDYTDDSEPDPILDAVNKRADANHRTKLETEALKQGLDPETAKHAAELADAGPLPLDEAIAFAKHNRAFAPDSPELTAAKAKTDAMLDAINQQNLPAPARDLAHLLPKAPKVGMKTTGDEGDSRASSEAAFRKSREGMHPGTTETIVKGKEFVLRGSEQGAVEPYGAVKTISSQRLENGDDPNSPIIKLATGERIIMEMPDTADPAIVSTHFENCGATVIRGVDPRTGKAVLLVGHVTEDDGEGHNARFAEDLKAMKAQGLTNLEVVVMPSFNDEPTKRLAELQVLQEHAGTGVKITEIPRPDGPEKHAHIVVTKDGVTVYTGDFDPNNPPEVLKNHEFGGTM